MTSDLTRTVALWVDGGAKSRANSRPRRVPGGYLIDFATADERARFVGDVADASAIAAMAEQISEERIWLKVPGERSRIAAFVPRPSTLVAAWGLR